MPTIVPVSRERHAAKHWKPFQSYAFARQSALVPLVAAEIPKAAMAMPLAFIRQGDQTLPVALMGLEPDKNVFVARDGRWLGPYVPSGLRGYPFSLARTEADTLVLCVDEDSGLVVDGPEGEPLFTAAGEPTEGLGRILEFLQQIERNRVLTSQACAALARHELVHTWPITLGGTTGERRVEGLFQIDEAALNQLSDEAFLDLRRAAALPIAYCQLLSIQHLPRLGELATASAAVPAPAPAASGFVLGDEDVLHFNWDRPETG
ncbi:SapC family protein [Thiocystis violacea]|uniref:SapC family protein n=1 Tax=Thiocystis violacea TaxID=13725 RepID=UPI001904BB73|nr:SapC family protein [Thiocystis violacea]MBK1719771.1 hypothetical protein [Thiocystis violacea]